MIRSMKQSSALSREEIESVLDDLEVGGLKESFPMFHKSGRVIIEDQERVRVERTTSPRSTTHLLTQTFSSAQSPRLNSVKSTPVTFDLYLVETTRGLFLLVGSSFSLLDYIYCADPFLVEEAVKIYAESLKKFLGILHAKFYNPFDSVIFHHANYNKHCYFVYKI